MGCLCAKPQRSDSEDIPKNDRISSISYCSTPSTPGLSPQARYTNDLDIHIGGEPEAEIIYDSSPNSTNGLQSFPFEDTDRHSDSDESARDDGSHRFHDPQKVALYSKQSSKAFASGAFASIFLCDVDGQQMAIKKLLIAMDDDADGVEEETDGIHHRFRGASTLKEAENELEILRCLCSDGGHRNVIKLVDSFYESTPYDDCYLYLVMEFVASSLDREIAKYQDDGAVIPSPLSKLYSVQILRALAFMERRGVIHRDLKPENVLLNPLSNEIRICDFGCSAMADPESTEQSMASYVCSRFYRAPELIMGSRRYGHAVDLWSFGAILSELYLGHTLFEGHRSDQQMTAIMQVLGRPDHDELVAMNSAGSIDEMEQRIERSFQIEDEEHFEPRNWKYTFIATEIEDDAINLIDAILRYDPAARLTAADALKHQWFEGMDGDRRLLDDYKVPIDILSAKQ